MCLRSNRTTAVNHRQEIIEIVRNATGQLADAIELLRLTQLQLEAPMCRDIAKNDHHADDVVFLVANRSGTIVNRKSGSIFSLKQRALGQL